MSADEPMPPEESFSSLLADCDEALRAGDTPRFADDSDVSPEQRRELEADLACVRLLRQVMTPAPTSSSAPPSALGRFTIRHELGRGTFGIVYLAYDPHLNREVALKVPRGDALSDPALLERFQREARAAAGLDHPHIVPVHEAGAVGPVCYIASAYCAGPTLAQWLKRRDQPVPVREAAELVATLAEAVQHAHGRGVVHRDLKPGNVLLQNGTADERRFTQIENQEDDASSLIRVHPRSSAVPLIPRITDFGLAKLFVGEGEASQTQSGAVVGTPSYMAPEQAGGQSKAVGPAADIYALGAILYELLTGRPPFVAEAALDTLLLVRTEEPVPPGRLRPKLPRDLETVCLKAMAKEPGRRYPTARQLADDLRRWLNGEPVRARPVSAVERLWRWGRRNPKLAGLTVTVAALLLAVTVVSVVSTLLVTAARNDALDEAGRRRQEVVKLLVTNGVRFMDDGDLFGSLPWFVRALELDQGDSEREAMHRDRIAAVLQQCPKLVRFWRHDGKVVYAEFDPEGRRVVTASDDGTARIWNSDTGELLATLRHDRPVRHATFSPDGDCVVTASADGTAHVWDASIGQPLTTFLKHDAEVTSAAFSPGGDRVATAGEDKTARLWNAATGEPLATLPHRFPVFQALFSPDGSLLATVARNLKEDATQSEVSLWDGATGMPLRRLRNKPGHDPIAFRVAFSPDGRRLITAGNRPNYDHGIACVWDVASGTALAFLYDNQSWFRDVQFSPDGRHVLTAGMFQAARIWDAATGQRVGEPMIHRGSVWRATYGPDGRHVLTCGSEGTARVWDAATSQPVSPWLRHGGPLPCAAFGPDGRRVLVASEDGAARLWDLATTERLLPPLKHWTHTSSVYRTEFSPDGQCVVTCNDNDEARVWCANSGEPLTPSLWHDGAVTRATFSPDGRRILTVSGASTHTVKPQAARVWHVATGRPHTPPLTHEFQLNHAAFSPDGRRVATASGLWIPRGAPVPMMSAGEGEVHLWDADTGETVLPALRHDGPVRHVEFSPDGLSLVTACGDGTSRVWEVATGRLRATLPHDAPVWHAQFSPDGRLILTSSSDATVRVWSAATGQRVSGPVKVDGTVGPSSFAPDSRRVATACGDGTAVIWEAESGRLLAPVLKYPVPILQAVFSPDGRRLLTRSRDGTVRIWEAATGRPLTPPWRYGAFVNDAAFSPDGRRVAVCGDSGLSQVWDLPVEGRPVADLLLLADLLAGHRIDAAGSHAPAAPDGLADTWRELAAKYPGQFTAAPPEMASWHRYQFQHSRERGNWTAALHHVDRLSALGCARANDWRDRAWAHANLGRWGQAAADYARALALRDDEQVWWVHYAWLSLACGDMPEYRRACAHQLERYGSSEHHRQQMWVVISCQMAPDAVADAERVVAVARKTESRLYYLGAALYRAGRWEEAVPHLEHAAKVTGHEATQEHCKGWLFLAMAYQRLGRTAEARRWLGEAREWISAARPREAPPGAPPQDVTMSRSWSNVLTAQLLYREAEALIRDNGGAAFP